MHAFNDATRSRPAPTLPLPALLNAVDGVPRVVALTFDTDWVPEFVLEALVDRLQRARVSATIFATDPSPVLSAAARDGTLEVGWHPNLAPGSSHGRDPDTVLTAFRAWYPQARGVRTHGLLQSSNLLRRFRAEGLAYDASTQLIGHPYLQPVRTPDGLWRVPYGWSDASHMLAEAPWHLDAVVPRLPGLAVLGWHPIHWYLNLATQAQYLAVRTAVPVLRDATPQALHAHRHAGVGTRSLFDALLAQLMAGTMHTVTLSALVEQCEDEARRHGGWRPCRFHDPQAPDATTRA